MGVDTLQSTRRIDEYGRTMIYLILCGLEIFCLIGSKKNLNARLYGRFFKECGLRFWGVSAADRLWSVIINTPVSLLYCIKIIEAIQHKIGLINPQATFLDSLERYSYKN